MNVLPRLVRRWTSITPLVGRTIYLDFGSRFTRIQVKGQSSYAQPSCMVYHPGSGTVVETGQLAWQSLDKVPASVQVVFPIKEGVVANSPQAVVYLQALLPKVFHNHAQAPILINSKVKVAVPASITPVERQLLLQTISLAGWGKATLIPKPQAAYAHLFGTQQHPQQACVIDVGGQTTEMGLFHEGKCIASTTITVGGDAYTQALVKLLRDEYQCVIGWLSAEALKLQYQKVMTTQTKSNRTPDYKLLVRGKDIVSGVPTTVSVSTSSIRIQFTEITQDLIMQIKTYMAQLAPELLTSTLENGLHITGGGSLLPGLTDFLSQELKSHFTLSKTPQEDVISGLTLL